MIKQIIEIASRLFVVTKDVQQSKSDIKKLEQENRDLRRELADITQELHDSTCGFERLAYEIRRVSDTEAQERKLMPLQLENEFLKFERRLPRSNSNSGDSGAK